MRVLTIAAALAIFSSQAGAQPEPIIDMHFHAHPADAMGPPGSKICVPYEEWPERDPSKPITDYLERFSGAPNCRRTLTGAGTDAELRTRNLAMLRKHNVIAVASGSPARVAEYARLARDRIIPGYEFGEGDLPPLEELRQLHKAGRLKVLGEITSQYGGMAPDDPRLEPYFALAEELDIPVAIHIGPGPPGGVYFAYPNYRAALGDPLRLEPVLVRHPKLRIYAMHAGWPLSEAMIAMMFSHPQLYVDTGIINYAYRRSDFHAYLKRLTDAGFAKRIMFGSDQMVWPEAIEAAIEGITSADFLSGQQKRDILYNNAARFLRLTPEQIAKRPGR